MFNFFKSSKKKNAEKHAKLWAQACVPMLVDDEARNTPRGQLGLACFVIGSIGTICEAHKIEKEIFQRFALVEMGRYGFSFERAKRILHLVTTQKDLPPFVKEAILDGGKAARGFFSGENTAAPMSLLTSISIWAENPDLTTTEKKLLNEANFGSS